MIKGLYEAHLPVSNLERSIEFYKNLDLELAYQKEKLAFFWIEKGRNWLELMAPLRLDVAEEFEMMSLEEWNKLGEIDPK